MTDEHFRRFLLLRKDKPVKIGPLWIEGRQVYYLGSADGLSREIISERDLATLIDHLWNESQMPIVFPERIQPDTVIITEESNDIRAIR